MKILHYLCYEISSKPLPKPLTWEGQRNIKKLIMPRNYQKKEHPIEKIQPRWMQKKSVLLYLGISEHFFARLISEGAFHAYPHNDVNGKHVVWYDKNEIDDYVKSLSLSSIHTHEGEVTA